MILVANWKMNKDIREAQFFMEAFFSNMSWCNNSNLNLFIAPSFPLLSELKKCISKNPVSYNLNLCAQNCHHYNEGAFTGEVSVRMLKSLDVSSVIIGHSERRQYFDESNIVLEKKVLICSQNNLLPIFCFGESKEQREKGDFLDIIESQITILKDFIQDNQEIILAYEPIWAIGTGATPSLKEIDQVHSFVKTIFPKINVLYGGSLNKSNVKGILSLPNVDGGLVGGASLDSSEFISIIRCAHEIC